MKNIFKFLRDKTAKVVQDNIITVEREDGKIAVFESNKDNYCIEYNTEIWMAVFTVTDTAVIIFESRRDRLAALKTT